MTFRDILKTYQCMALFLNAVVTHSAEKMDGKHERNKVIHMPDTFGGVNRHNYLYYICHLLLLFPSKGRVNPLSGKS
ncbi:ORF1306 [White spot syndrome virus]|uniref:ORF1306 n=1 Tax=White spot syndrome virus TaxID=342409 RepID=A0A2D3I6A3_9VIRU|nr:ORF1306 [White spot syndrome virus]